MARPTYRERATALFRDSAASFSLKKRVGEDDDRDAADALRDAEVLHELASQRFH